MNHGQRRNARVIYDVMYGFIPITEWEEKIINSPFYQRLRWIKQLGFANYIFPGAEHNRFAHAIGVMHSMDQMIRALGLDVPDVELFNPKSKNPAAMLHKTLRISALLHDIGTFPFSHSIEFSYIRHGNDQRRDGLDLKKLPNNHEHLGSFIIKNTRYNGGLTQILEEYGFDIGFLSKIIKGDSSHVIANQLMHSDLDADRMDYLLRDSHYTGIKYGQFDRDYILANLMTYPIGKGQIGFGVRENAAHAVEDFLFARYWWYSQVVKNPGSAKFDVIASHVAQAFLQSDLIHQFQDLLNMVEQRDQRFFWWNDVYFISRCQEILTQKLVKDPQILELTEALLFRKPPKTVNHSAFHPKMYPAHDSDASKVKGVKQVQDLVAEMERVIAKKGKGKEWILADLPHKDMVVTAGLQKIKKTRKGENLLAERDPIKVIGRDGQVSLLVEKEDTLIRSIAGMIHFIPSVYCNESAYALLKGHFKF